MNALIVTASAALMRAFPLVVGMVIAQVAGSSEYADFVLSLSLLNIFASFIQLSVVPQIIRSNSGTTSDDSFGAIAYCAAWLFVPVAAALIVIGPTRQPSPLISIVAAGVVIAMLTGAIASAILCREKAFATLLWSAITFFIVAAIPLVAAISLVASVDDYIGVYGVWIAAAGCSWLIVVFRPQRLKYLSILLRSAPWKNFIRDALLSASFGVLMMLGFYLTNLAATQIVDVANRVVVAVGLQLFAIVVFVPSALSSYIVPKLRSADVAGARSLVSRSATIYLVLGSAAAFVALLLRPILERLYRVEIVGDARIALMLILAAAVFAGANAIFNQVFVATRQFGLQLCFAGLWLLALAIGLWMANGDVVGAGLAFCGAYVLLFAVSLTQFRLDQRVGVSPVDPTAH